jgi:hypothetical protein
LAKHHINSEKFNGNHSVLANVENNDSGENYFTSDKVLIDAYAATTFIIVTVTIMTISIMPSLDRLTREY